MKHLFALFFAFFCCHLHAEVYKWTDQHGVVHYEDKQPTQAEKIAPAAVEKMALPTPPVISTGDTAKSAAEAPSLWTQWIAKAQTFRDDMLQRFERWREKTPVITNQTLATAGDGNALAKQPNVVEIYTAVWCGVCKKAKRWFNDRGIVYKEYDVEKDVNAAVRMRKLGGTNSVPFTVINGKTFQGFNAAGYQAALH